MIDALSAGLYHVLELSLNYIRLILFSTYDVIRMQRIIASQVGKNIAITPLLYLVLLLTEQC